VNANILYWIILSSHKAWNWFTISGRNNIDYLGLDFSLKPYESVFIPLGIFHGKCNVKNLSKKFSRTLQTILPTYTRNHCRCCSLISYANIMEKGRKFLARKIEEDKWLSFVCFFRPSFRTLLLPAVRMKTRVKKKGLDWWRNKMWAGDGCKWQETPWHCLIIGCVRLH
jgi:hypothetical protein